MTRHVYLVRHGEQAHNWTVHPDSPLSARGEAQAAEVAKTLNEVISDHQSVAVYSSPLRRAQQTAMPFCETSNQKVLTKPQIAEIPPPATLPLDKRSAWLRSIWDTPMDELPAHVLEWREGIRSVLTTPIQADVLVCFAHFMVLNTAVGIATGAKTLLTFEPAHGSICEFQVDRDNLKLTRLGDATKLRAL